MRALLLALLAQLLAMVRALPLALLAQLLALVRALLRALLAQLLAVVLVLLLARLLAVVLAVARLLAVVRALLAVLLPAVVRVLLVQLARLLLLWLLLRVLVWVLPDRIQAAAHRQPVIRLTTEMDTREVWAMRKRLQGGRSLSSAQPLTPRPKRTSWSAKPSCVHTILGMQLAGSLAEFTRGECPLQSSSEHRRQISL